MLISPNSVQLCKVFYGDKFIIIAILWAIPSFNRNQTETNMKQIMEHDEHSLILHWNLFIGLHNFAFPID